MHWKRFPEAGSLAYPLPQWRASRSILPEIMQYFCARILIVCLVDDDKPRKRNTCDRQFVMVRARDYEHAFERALEFGCDAEVTYKNAKGQKVRWVFVSVEEIKRLGRRIDGCEVGSALGDVQFLKGLSFKKRFRPEKYSPLQD
jgi:hypothetical protein